MSETAFDILSDLCVHGQKMKKVREAIEPEIAEIWNHFTYSRMFASAWSEAQIKACIRFPGTLIDGKTGLVVNPYKKSPPSAD